MRATSNGYLASVLMSPEAPCVSIYLPAHRANGNAKGSLTDQQNRTLYRNLADRAAEVLTKSYPESVSSRIVEQLHKLQADDQFWSHVLDGVAVLASPQRFDTFSLPRKMPEFVTVGETFHVKPLLRFVQSAEPFHVLGVSRERVALFQGNRYDLRPLEVPGIPLKLTDALGEEVDDPQAQYHTAGPSRAVGPGSPGRAAMIAHGHGSKKDEVLNDMHRFFRVVDREIIHRVSEPTGLPLILMGIDANVAEFRAVSKNRFLLEESIHGDWTNLALPEIRERAWKVFEKHYLDRLARIREDFGTAFAQGKATGDLSDAAKAAVAGRIGILLIDDDRTEPGMIDADGNLHPAATKNDATGDMLDDLAELALRTKADVIVTPSSQMPTKTGLAAIFRY